MLITALLIAIAVFQGTELALKFIAPKTKTDKDDKILAAMEKADPVVQMLKEKVEADKAAPKA